jgi:hypothetical protein
MPVGLLEERAAESPVGSRSRSPAQRAETRYESAKLRRCAPVVRHAAESLLHRGVESSTFYWWDPQSLARRTTTIESWLTRSQRGSSPAAHAGRGTKERVSGCSCVAGSRVSSGSIAGCERVAPDRTHDIAIATRFVCRYGCLLRPSAHPSRPPGSRSDVPEAPRTGCPVAFVAGRAWHAGVFPCWQRVGPGLAARPRSKPLVGLTCRYSES